VFAEYRAQLHRANLREPEEAFRDACSLLREPGAELGIRCMIVDEAQDISASAFTLIRTAVPVAGNDLFIVGDAHQRIYRHKVVLGRLGIEVRGRSKKLRVNYRTTDEIRRWACAELEGCEVDDLDGNLDSLKGYRSLTHGDVPDVLASASVAQDIELILGILRQLEADGVDGHQVCITARTNEEVEIYSNRLGQHGIAHLRLERNTADDQAIAGVRLATMHRVKGLEFEVVILAGYKSPQAYAEAFSRDEDAGVNDDTETAERCLLHVAATRAKRHLWVLQRPLKR
jgi:superfamily I DNA/RNA helicase